MNTGKCEWFIPDAYYPAMDNGEHYVSHEAVCVLNTGDENAVINFTLYFEDRPPVTGFSATCPAARTHHIRMDQIQSEDGSSIPRGVSYAILAKSNVPVIIQYSRCDTTQPQMALMSLIAY